MPEVKVGIIGCGGIARHHLSKLSKIPEVKLVAYADVVLERAKECAKIYGGNAYQDYHTMLDKEQIDACFICIPPFAHTDQEIICAEKDIHFFVEKPVALTLKKAKEILKAVERYKIITQVGYVMRFVDAFIKAREVLHSRGGELGLFEAWRYGGVVGDVTHWWRHRELSGGQLVEQSTHQVDLARWYMGDVEEVFARFQTTLLNDLPGFSIESASIVTLKFKNNAIGVITSTCASQKKGRTSGFRIIARKLQIESLPSRSCRIIEGDNIQEIRNVRDPFLEEDKHFIQCVIKGEETNVPYIEGVKTLEVTLAAVKSAETGRNIRLPLT